MTIENLAEMMQREFRALDKRFATKDDLNGFATKDDLNGLATKDDLKALFEYVEHIRDDVRDIKITLGPLVHIAAGHDNEIGDMRIRIARLERKAGISK